MTYEEEFRININNLFEKYNHEMSEIEKQVIEKFILNCKDNNISIKDGLEELEKELSQHTNINNDGNFEKFKNSIVSKLPTIPNHITEEWLLNALENELFHIWGFSFSDLSNCTFDNISEDTLRKVTISSYTKFPPSHPFQLDYKSLNDKDIHLLHNQGITGVGVNIAIIDQGFSVVHDEVKHCLKKYQNPCGQDSFHGLVVTSVLGGKNIGVAPDSNIYFYGHSQNKDQGIVDTINALKEIYNKNLNGANIKIVNISGYIHTLSPEFETIKGKLEEQGCYIIDSPTFGKLFTCINQTNSNDKTEYFYSSWQETDSEQLKTFKSKIAVPFNGLVPLFNTNDSYQKCGEVSYSWVIPKLSGIFALCLQLKPDMTLEQVASLAYQTKIATEDGIMVINPKGMLEKLVFDLEENKSL